MKQSFKSYPTQDKVTVHGYFNTIFENVELIDVIQIGAGCGGWEISEMGDSSPHLNDPCWRLFLNKKSWKCYLFEPVQSEFLRCIEFYKNLSDNINIYNAVVTTHNHNLDTINIRKSKSMSSLMTEHRKNDKYSQIVDKKLVPAVNINSIVGIINPYWVQIDTEGMDYDLVVSMMLAGINLPKVLSFEWCFIQHEEMEKLTSQLNNMGYYLCFKSNWDVVFIRK